MSVTDILFNTLLRREAEDPDGGDEDATRGEIFASWSLFILIMLLIVALMTSYFLQTRRIQAVHETVISIFAGMFVGLILRLTAAHSVLGAVSFDYKFFFNLLLPPIILASGFELHQDNFFRKIGTILTFAFLGTFISAIVLYFWTRIPVDPSVRLTLVDAMSLGATLSATDPVTILAIFNMYKVDPHLYTVIFGESILNDAVAIVLFETAQKYRDGADQMNFLAFLECIGIFLIIFFGSLLIGLIVGIATSVLLKMTMLRRYPQIESCMVVLIAYASYFFANAIHMSGIVSLLFCGICLRRYAFHNMSRRTQLTSKFVFQLTAQLSENFIFIYLGLSLFTDTQLDFRPSFILLSVVGVCIARGAAVFPISKLINWVIKKSQAKDRPLDAPDPLPFEHQMMLFWAGLRGAVGVALAAGLVGPNGMVLRATVLIVVVLTVIIFGGTTAKMLEILNIRTGVVEQADSDDEFDIEVVGRVRRSYAEYGEFDREDVVPLNGQTTPLSSRQYSLKQWPSFSSSPPHKNGARAAAAAAAATDDPVPPTTLHRTSSRASQMKDQDNIPDSLGDGLDLPPPPPPVRRSTIPPPLTSANSTGLLAGQPVRRVSPSIPAGGQEESSVVGVLRRWDQRLMPVILVNPTDGAPRAGSQHRGPNKDSS